MVNEEKSPPEVTNVSTNTHVNHLVDVDMSFVSVLSHVIKVPLAASSVTLCWGQETERITQELKGALKYVPSLYNEFFIRPFCLPDL